MSKEIEEMAKIMCQDAGTKNCNIRCSAKPICDVNFYAERLYNRGWRKQSGWISVDDRLPENDDAVLCWYEYFRYGDYNRMYQTYGIGYCFNGRLWGGDVMEGAKCRVIAWMPLPEPPKMKEREGRQ